MAHNANNRSGRRKDLKLNIFRLLSLRISDCHHGAELGLHNKHDNPTGMKYSTPQVMLVYNLGWNGAKGESSPTKLAIAIGLQMFIKIFRLKINARNWFGLITF